MAACQEEEKQSIRDFAKSLKKYGSTCNHFKRQEQYVKHHIIQGDTLQGIALKYGVNVSEILSYFFFKCHLIISSVLAYLFIYFILFIFHINIIFFLY